MIKLRDYFLKPMKTRTNVDWYLSASEAKSIGLVDHVGLPGLIRQ
jgi:ATP-dependent protease ClpP protease subunit